MNVPLRRAIFLDRDGVLNRAVVRDGKPYPPASLDELDIPAAVPAALTPCRHCWKVAKDFSKRSTNS